jgi:hypothetical protein
MNNRIVVNTQNNILTLAFENINDGSALTGIAYNTAGLTIRVLRPNLATSDTLSLISSTPNTWTGGTTFQAGFCPVDAAGIPGLYQLSLPNIYQGFFKDIIVYASGAANMRPYLERVPYVGHQHGITSDHLSYINATYGNTGVLMMGQGYISPIFLVASGSDVLLDDLPDFGISEADLVGLYIVAEWYTGVFLQYRPARFVWKITAVSSSVITSQPIGHNVTLLSALSTLQIQSTTLYALPQQTILSTAATDVTAAKTRVETALPNAVPNASSGLPLRSWFADKLSADVLSVASIFTQMLEQVTDWRWKATALSQTPSSGSGGLTTDQATKLTEAHTRVTLALPNAAPDTDSGLPIKSGLAGLLTSARLQTLDWLASMIELVSANRRFKATALATAPAGSAESSGLTTEEQAALFRIAARLGTHGGTEETATDGTITQVLQGPDGLELTLVSAPTSEGRTLTVTVTGGG